MVKVEILSSPGCHSCETAKKKIHQIVEEMREEIPDLEVKEHDVTEAPELMAEHQIMSTPAILVNGKVVYTGVPKRETIQEYIRIGAK